MPLALIDYTISDTLHFLSLHKNQPLDNTEEYVFSDADSLFTSIPLKEATYFILDEILVDKKM